MQQISFNQKDLEINLTFAYTKVNEIQTLDFELNVVDLDSDFLSGFLIFTDKVKRYSSSFTFPIEHGASCIKIKEVFLSDVTQTTDALLVLKQKTEEKSFFVQITWVKTEKQSEGETLPLRSSLEVDDVNTKQNNTPKLITVAESTSNPKSEPSIDVQTLDVAVQNICNMIQLTANTLQKEITNLRTEMNTKMSSIETNIQNLRTEMNTSVSSIESSIDSMKIQISEIKTNVTDIIDSQGFQSDQIDKIVKQVALTSRGFQLDKMSSYNNMLYNLISINTEIALGAALNYFLAADTQGLLKWTPFDNKKFYKKDHPEVFKNLKSGYSNTYNYFKSAYPEVDFAEVSPFTNFIEFNLISTNQEKNSARIGEVTCGDVSLHEDLKLKKLLQIERKLVFITKCNFIIERVYFAALNHADSYDFSHLPLLKSFNDQNKLTLITLSRTTL